MKIVAKTCSSLKMSAQVVSEMANLTRVTVLICTVSAYLEGLRVEQTVDGLRDVGRVDVVVVGHRAMVVVLEGQAEGDQGAGIYLELAQQVPLLEQEVQQGYTNPLQRPQV